MKLLLTSAGFTNKSIVAALESLADKPFSKLSMAFVPTAANVAEGNKDWVIDDLVTCKNLGFASIDIVDISALPMEIWKPRIEKADVLFFEGGNTFHLMNWVKKSGLQDQMRELLKTKIYVGLSAGSMIAAPWWSNDFDTKYYREKPEETDRYDCLGLVDFFILPHLNSSFFTDVTLENMEKLAKQIPSPVYVLDDNGAVMVDGDKGEVVCEGIWRKFN